MYEQQHYDDWEHIVTDSGATKLLVSTAAVFDKASGGGVQGRGLLPVEEMLCFDHPEDKASSFWGALKEEKRQASSRLFAINIGKY